MRYIARCLTAKGDSDGAELWLLRACFEAPEQREPLVELARLMAGAGRWAECERYCRRALDIQKRDMSYITDPAAWGALPWELLSQACWRQGEGLWAVNCARRALELEPENGRIRRALADMGGGEP